jgi:hypothetical protein
MIKKISVIICLCLGLTFVACTNDTTSETTKSNKAATTTPTTTEPTKEEEIKETPVVEAEKITLTTYTANSDTYAIEKLSDIKVDKTSTLQEKLKALADELSIKVFKGLPITVVEIETSNGSTKAIINLEEAGTDPNIKWNTGFFQGSAGGTITSKSLIETFTQKSYTGEWVDSIEFHYNGEKIEAQHAPSLGEIVKR